MSDDLQDSGSARAAILLFAIIVILIGWDVIADYREGANWGHMAIELFVLLIKNSDPGCQNSSSAGTPESRIPPPTPAGISVTMLTT